MVSVVVEGQRRRFRLQFSTKIDSDGFGRLFEAGERISHVSRDPVGHGVKGGARLI